MIHIVDTCQGLALLLTMLALARPLLAVEPPDWVQRLPVVAGLPDPFLKADGTRVATAAEWPAQRAHLADLAQEYIYGHLPPAGAVTTTTVSTTHDEALGATRQELLLATGPEGRVPIHVHLTIPDGAGPFPAIAVGDVCWGRVAPEILAAVVARRYVLAEFDRTEICPDSAERGVGLYAAHPDSDGGCLAAWAWGYQRVIDALQAHPAVDRAHLAITGHSRCGKAVLLAGALDERIALVAPNGSGCGGGGCLRVLIGKCEGLDRIATVFPFWFSKRFAGFIGAVEHLPLDAHTLKSLVAPRALLTTDGLGDDWANPAGVQVSWAAARVVYGWLGVAARCGLAFRPGGHAHNLVDWQELLDFADLQFRGAPCARPFDQLPFPVVSPPPFAWTAP